MHDYSTIYQKKLRESQALYESRIQRLFNDVARGYAALANSPDIKFSSSFDLGFKYGDRIKVRMDALMQNFHDNMLELVQGGATESWNLSNVKNDKIASTYLAGLAGLKETERYFKPNTEALKAFITRKRDSLTLSDRIWKVATRYRQELDIHLGFGVLNGDSADTISRRIRYYQNNPETLFRRVRDAKGNLVLSENAKAFHPGQGIYRSAYKNARRLTRETLNQSFRESDYVRWLQLDFVVGVKIALSAAHPVVDICDFLVGVYPKWFKWMGWHVQCICIATPVLMNREDFRKQLAGEKVDLPQQVRYVPEGFTKWVEENKTKVMGWKSQPFWVQDNFKGGTIKNGLKGMAKT